MPYHDRELIKPRPRPLHPEDTDDNRDHETVLDRMVR